jgi:hypothetical protein
MRCLEKDPAHRPQTAEELIAALDGCAAANEWSAAAACAWWGERGGAGGASTAPAPAAGAAKTATVTVRLDERIGSPPDSAAYDPSVYDQTPLP